MGCFFGEGRFCRSCECVCFVCLRIILEGMILAMARSICIQYVYLPFVDKLFVYWSNCTQNRTLSDKIKILYVHSLFLDHLLLMFQNIVIVSVVRINTMCVSFISVFPRTTKQFAPYLENSDCYIELCK